MNEYVDEVYAQLEQIEKITSNIQKIYVALMCLYMNKDFMLDYDDQITGLVNALTAFKIEEDNAYELFNNNLLYTASAGLIINKKKEQASKESKLCLERIFNRLRIICDKMPDFIGFTNELGSPSLNYQLLLKQGASNEEASYFVQNYEIMMNNFTARHFAIFAQEEANSTKIPSEIAKYLKLMLDSIFTLGDAVEDEFIASRFTTLKKTLSDEIKSTFGISENAKNMYMNLEGLSDANELLLSLFQAVPSFETTKSVIAFKVIILYLDNEYLETIKNTICSANFKVPIISDLLIQAIDNIEKLRAKHNSDIKPIEFN